MIPIDTYFKVNSETDENELIKLYNTVAKRINAIRAHRALPKAEVVQKEDKDVPNTDVLPNSECANDTEI